MKIADFFEDGGRSLKWDVIESIPQFETLSSTGQSEKWHKEGDVLSHTRLVVSEMEKLMADESDNERYHLMVCAALFHDIGKGIRTFFDKEKAAYVTKGHGQAGAAITRTIIEDEDVQLREKLCYMVRNHMALHHILEKDDSAIDRKLIEMSLGWVSVGDMLALCRCDDYGSINDVWDDDGKENKYMKIRAKAESLGCLEQPYQFSSSDQKHRFFAYGDMDEPCRSDGHPFSVMVVIGLPGSGKNTYIDKYLSTLPSVSRDDIRKKMGLPGEKPQGDKAQEREVTKIFDDEVYALLANKQSFVVNNVNMRPEYRMELLSKVSAHNVKIYYVYINTPVDICKERRKCMMPLSVIDRMWSGFDFPTEAEYDGLFIVDGTNIID